MGKRLIVNEGERVVRYEIVEDAMVIGREPDCDIVLSDPEISRRHAHLVPNDEGVRLIDLDSRNGSWVNDAKVREVTITTEDTVRLGGAIITLEEDSPPAPSETVLLSENTVPEDGGQTVMLDLGAPGTDSRTGEEDSAGTVFLERVEPANEDSAVCLSDDSAPGDEDEAATVLLESPKPADGEFTVYLHQELSAQVEGDSEEDDPGTVVLEDGPSDHEASEMVADSPTGEEDQPSKRRRFGGRLFSFWWDRGS